MDYKRSTCVPNIILDTYLPVLSLAELKVLLIIIRQTFGWVNKQTNKRKTKDRISHSQFIEKTGVSRKAVSLAIHTLVEKEIIEVSDARGNNLFEPEKRKGKLHLYYAFALNPVHISIVSYVKDDLQPVQKKGYNKTNITKLTTTKRESGMQPIGVLIEEIQQRIKKETSD